MAKRSVTVSAEVPSADPDTVFTRLQDFSSYADHADVVREITIERDEGGTQVSNWSVWFRNGLLQWTERDTVDPETRTLSFEQITGDLAAFSGAWRVESRADAVVIGFAAEIDLGIPSLADMLDPLAERALITNTTTIIQGLFGPGLEVVR